jgi:hypothetical protein
MPYNIVCDGPMGPKHCRIIKKEDGKVAAHAENKKDAGLYVAFADKKIKPKSKLGDSNART